MVIEAVVEAYRNRREEIRARLGRTREQLGAVGRIEQPRPNCSARTCSTKRSRPWSTAAIPSTEASERRRSSRRQSVLEFLLARGSNGTVELTLDAMMAGGIYDQIGGGFARYSVDRESG